MQSDPPKDSKQIAISTFVNPEPKDQTQPQTMTEPELHTPLGPSQYSDRPQTPEKSENPLSLFNSVISPILEERLSSKRHIDEQNTEQIKRQRLEPQQPTQSSAPHQKGFLEGLQETASTFDHHTFTTKPKAAVRGRGGKFNSRKPKSHPGLAASAYSPPPPTQEQIPVPTKDTIRGGKFNSRKPKSHPGASAPAYTPSPPTQEQSLVPTKDTLRGGKFNSRKPKSHPGPSASAYTPPPLTEEQSPVPAKDTLSYLSHKIGANPGGLPQRGRSAGGKRKNNNKESNEAVLNSETLPNHLQNNGFPQPYLPPLTGGEASQTTHHKAPQRGRPGRRGENKPKSQKPLGRISLPTPSSYYPSSDALPDRLASPNVSFGLGGPRLTSPNVSASLRNNDLSFLPFASSWINRSNNNNRSSTPDPYSEFARNQQHELPSGTLSNLWPANSQTSALPKLPWDRPSAAQSPHHSFPSFYTPRHNRTREEQDIPSPRRPSVAPLDMESYYTAKPGLDAKPIYSDMVYMTPGQFGDMSLSRLPWSQTPSVLSGHFSFAPSNYFRMHPSTTNDEAGPSGLPRQSNPADDSSRNKHERVSAANSKERPTVGNTRERPSVGNARERPSVGHSRERPSVGNSAANSKERGASTVNSKERVSTRNSKEKEKALLKGSTLNSKEKAEHDEERDSQSLMDKKDMALLPYMYPKPTSEKTCQICSKTFTRRSSLFKHVRSVHLKHRPFVCELCSATFTQRSSLQTHILGIHKRIKNHSCQFCVKSFTTRGDLQRHLKAIHYNES